MRYFIAILVVKKQGCQNHDFFLGRKGRVKSKIVNRKIVIKIKGFYSTTFVESI